ncbi:hypothetical protein CKO28_00375 [Rhodovibrio sodomensis]|uniref:Peptidase M20 dimerisation domain-containing protein n=1 Tax=Rhodovibrio sodomensis TaxID=1088 RepID=A0ABS1D822_9PROT|nr:M20 aminoacylase family protein [Rhodovibrio sodomensis]MBK1666495.1 hypothetical protein [Rhodovibrio sodomensis]
MAFDIDALKDQLVSWRRDLHRHPELAFEEERTSHFVADRLRDMGIEVVTGLGRTGVVGKIEGRGGGNRAIGLRADMDALPIEEQTGLPYASGNAGRMHACGHDGHTTMLLGAAQALAETRDFSGTVYVIFQPAEENGNAGGRAMIDDGLFASCPVDAVYGLHNWPGMAVGRLAVRAGPMMASMDTFDIDLTGAGAHAAMPHQGRDPILAGAAMVSGLQSLVSREIAPSDSLVITVTQFHAGDAYNLIPVTAALKGTVRALDPQVREQAEARLKELIDGYARSHGVSAEVRYSRDYPVTVNTSQESETCARVAEGVGLEVERDRAPAMGAEDFAFMLEERPGAYVWLGNGPSTGGANLHSPTYDFNDEILTTGVRYWTRLVEHLMPA